MQVILLSDVQGLGKAGQLAKTSDGYARNFLIPRKLVMEATPGNLKAWEKKQEAIKAQRAADIAAAEEIKKLLESGKTVRLVSKAGGSGRLFGAVTSQDIADAIKNELGIEIDKKKIVLDAPIKETGVKSIDIKLFQGITAKCRLEVVSE